MQLRSSPDKQNNGLRWRYQLICNGALGAGVRQYLGLQAQALCYLEHIALGLLLHLYVGKHHADLFDPQRRMRFDGMRTLYQMGFDPHHHPYSASVFRVGSVVFHVLHVCVCFKSA